VWAQVSFTLSTNTPWASASFTGDQNVEVAYLFAYAGPVPATNGDAYAPSVELAIGLKPPFYKTELWDDGTNITHAFAYAAPRLLLCLHTHVPMGIMSTKAGHD
jgi:hypothetical protein